MTDIRRLDGTPVEPEKARRSDRIAGLLKRLWALNEAGELSAVAVVVANYDGSCSTDFEFEPGLGRTMHMIGCLHALQNDMLENSIGEPRLSPPEPVGNPIDAG